MKNVVFAFIALCLFFSGCKKDTNTESILNEIGAYGKWDYVDGVGRGFFLRFDSTEFEYLIISYPARYELSRKSNPGSNDCSYVSQKGRIEITEKVDSLAYIVNFDPIIGAFLAGDRIISVDDGKMIIENYDTFKYTFKKEY